MSIGPPEPWITNGTNHALNPALYVEQRLPRRARPAVR